MMTELRRRGGWRLGCIDGGVAGSDDDYAAADRDGLGGFVVGYEAQGVDYAGEPFAGDAEGFHAAVADAEEDGVVFGGDALEAGVVDLFSGADFDAQGADEVHFAEGFFGMRVCIRRLRRC